MATEDTETRIQASRLGDILVDRRACTREAMEDLIAAARLDVASGVYELTGRLWDNLGAEGAMVHARCCVLFARAVDDGNAARLLAEARRACDAAIQGGVAREAVEAEPLLHGLLGPGG